MHSSLGSAPSIRREEPLQNISDSYVEPLFPFSGCGIPVCDQGLILFCVKIMFVYECHDFIAGECVWSRSIGASLLAISIMFCLSLSF